MNNIIVVSDLHLGEGESSPFEDFFYEKEFAKLLNYYQEEPTTLVLNGDIIDFLQIIKTSPEFELTNNEKLYGMNTTPEKSVWKLNYCFKQHTKFFKSLGEFLEKGNKIVHIKGNHDAEFYWPRVRETFRKQLKNYGAFSQNQLKFEQWFYYEPKRVYVEHGNQYDTTNSFCNFLYPVLPFAQDQIELPLGSFFCRYLFNRIEALDPFADNVKPVFRYLGWVFTHRPILALKVLRYYFPALGKVWNKSRLLTHTKEQKMQLESIQNYELKKLAKQKCIASDILKKLDSLHAKPILESAHFFLRIIRESLFEEVPLDYTARIIKKLLGVKHIIFGHTHYAQKTKEHINEGTWTPVIKDKKIDSIQSKRLTYALIKGMDATLEEWR